MGQIEKARQNFFFHKKKKKKMKWREKKKITEKRTIISMALCVMLAAVWCGVRREEKRREIFNPFLQKGGRWRANFQKTTARFSRQNSEEKKNQLRKFENLFRLSRTTPVVLLGKSWKVTSPPSNNHDLIIIITSSDSSSSSEPIVMFGFSFRLAFHLRCAVRSFCGKVISGHISWKC